VRAIDALKKSGYTDTKEKEVGGAGAREQNRQPQKINFQISRGLIDIVHIYGSSLVHADAPQK